MADLFRSMTPDRDSRKARDLLDSEWVQCDKCGGGYRTGGWPFCKGKPTDHFRDFDEHTASVWAEASKAHAKRPNVTSEEK